jgi:hypothetical protein
VSKEFVSLVGLPVHTADGEELGRFKEERDGHFLVNVSWRPDYWLPMDTIAGTDDLTQAIQLRCRRDDVDVLRLDRLPARVDVLEPSIAATSGAREEVQS